jgi:hypothetical protein
MPFNAKRRTAETLIGAIKTGLLESELVNDLNSNSVSVLTNVRDFLAQKFTVALFESDEVYADTAVLKELWKQVTGEDTL